MVKDSSSSGKQVKFMEKAFIIGIALILIGSLPLISGNENLQPVSDYKGTVNNAQLGWNLTQVGYINSDSVMDYAMGSPGSNKAYVYYGPLETGFNPLTNADITYTGPANSDFGWDIQSARDYNRDGRDDIIIGAPGIDKAYIFSGTQTGPVSHSSAQFTINGTSGDSFGHSVTAIDFEGVGHSFAVIGAPYNTHYIDPLGDFQTGAVYLFNLSNPTPPTYLEAGTDSDYIYLGDTDNGMFGFTVRNLGNIDGDSSDLDDLGISDPYHSPTGYFNKGIVYIHYGKNLLAEPPQRLSSTLDGYIAGAANESLFGWSFKGLGDIRGSTEEEFIIGAPMEAEGKAYLFFGTTTSFTTDLSSGGTADNEFNGSRSGDRFGMSFDTAIMAGGSLIVLNIGAPGYDNGTTMNAGAVYSFWSWATVNSANNAQSSYLGDDTNGNLGYSLCGVNYTLDSDPTYIGAVMASSPYYGNSNTGRIEILRRNQLPTLSGVNINFNTGNDQTIFTIRMEYKDPENDPPVFMKVDFFYDSSGDRPAKTVTLSRNPSDTDPFSIGVTYEAFVNLTNSIVPLEPNRPLYLRGATQALRGSVAPIFSGPIIQGPVIDGIKPSAPGNLNEIKYTSLPPEELIPGTFKISWEWPEDNDGFHNAFSEPVKSLEIRYMAGNKTITNANWNDALEYTVFSTLQVKDPFTYDSLLMGADEGLFLPRQYYSVAMRATDEVDNIGDVSETISMEAYWRRPDIPGPIQEVNIIDRPDDDGGAIRVTQFTPPNMDVPSDIGEYRVFVLHENDFDMDIHAFINNVNWIPEVILKKDVPEDEEGFYNFTFDVESYHDGMLEDGEHYYIGMLAVNWLGQHQNQVKWSELPVQVINDNEPPIDKIQNVKGTAIEGENQIRLQWTPTTDEKFVEYRIYGLNYPSEKLQDYVMITNITDPTTSEFIVDEVKGDPIIQGFYYSFAVLAYDHNLKMDTELVWGENMDKGILYIHQKAPLPQIKGVSMSDVPNDGGSALTLSWFKSFDLSFWEYHVYFSDEPIEDITGMDPVEIIRTSGQTDTVISEFDGYPLMDGKDYYAAVTIMDWNLVENTFIDIENQNNTDSAQSVNQSDFDAPIIYPGGIEIDGKPTKTQFNITWSPIDPEQVIDFNHYLITVTGSKGTITKIVEDVNGGRVVVDRLDRGKLYYFNISIVDDNGNIGPGSNSMEVETDGKNQPPMVMKIIVTVGEELTYLDNKPDAENTSVEVNLIDFTDIYFTAEAIDDYTVPSKLTYSWNITLPSGENIEKSSYSFGIDLTDKGTYRVVLVVTDADAERLVSEEFEITIVAQKKTLDDDGPNWLVISLIIVGAFILAIVVILFVLMSGSRSQKKQRLEEYEERRNDIKTMEPIYANLPTWTCECGTTMVSIIEHAYCNACYQSHEKIPIDGIDNYLTEHDLVLSEMNVDVPPGWQGQDLAISQADKDLEERKERAIDALNEEYAQWLKGTEYESELKEPIEESEEPEVATPNIMHHQGAIVPGAAPPSGPVQSGPIVPGQAGPIRPMVGGQPPAGQVRPPVVPQAGQPQVRPPVVPQAGAPGQRPPMAQVGQPQVRPPQPPQQ